jgi:hypothetical protein
VPSKSRLNLKGQGFTVRDKIEIAFWEYGPGTVARGVRRFVAWGIKRSSNWETIAQHAGFDVARLDDRDFSNE